MKWRKDSDGDYNLTKEASPTWFAVVYQYDAKWHVRGGTRARDGETQRLFRLKRGWSSPATAKTKALEAIRYFQYEEADIAEAGSN